MEYLHPYNFAWVQHQWQMYFAARGNILCQGYKDASSENHLAAHALEGFAS